MCGLISGTYQRATYNLDRCGRMEVQHKETETGRLPRNEEIRKKERDKDKELMKEGLSAGDV